ncbi:DUF6640 family protein [Amycolatopsis sp. SID8362]|uniref:DUF6640 family protein n=1 Tax=Amycolatopsis sp. SID8362 TaxID=2690346 RepID=UPI00136DA92C|nr:DUF6640 family protein [Amycolatopsis sp. SID8362]NBH06844.1 acetyltransferase [Amycolatopsis sp. SID8362]NED43541.1 acetyltransferase [Amycolatopsis sp. SID8362]
MSRKPLGRALISLTSLLTAVGPYRADWNETHVYNPAWPPHAKFHNGQTMSLGLALGVTSLWQLWRPSSGRAGLDAGAALASLYWVTQVSALAYPGSRAVDPPGKGFPQAKVAFPALAVTALGYLLERRRLARG